MLPSAKCTRPLFQGRTGCGGRPSGWHDIVTCQHLVLSCVVLLCLTYLPMVYFASFSLFCFFIVAALTLNEAKAKARNTRPRPKASRPRPENLASRPRPRPNNLDDMVIYYLSCYYMVYAKVAFYLRICLLYALIVCIRRLQPRELAGCYFKGIIYVLASSCMLTI